MATLLESFSSTACTKEANEEKRKGKKGLRRVNEGGLGRQQEQILIWFLAAIAQLIITEKHLPPTQRVIQAKNSGGVAGTSKNMNRGFL